MVGISLPQPPPPMGPDDGIHRTGCRLPTRRPRRANQRANSVRSAVLWGGTRTARSPSVCTRVRNARTPAKHDGHTRRGPLARPTCLDVTREGNVVGENRFDRRQTYQWQMTSGISSVRRSTAGFVAAHRWARSVPSPRKQRGYRVTVSDRYAATGVRTEFTRKGRARCTPPKFVHESRGQFAVHERCSQPRVRGPAAEEAQVTEWLGGPTRSLAGDVLTAVKRSTQKKRKNCY